MDLSKIEFRNGTLYLHQRKGVDTLKKRPGSFPENPALRVEHRESVLSKHINTRRIVLLAPLTHKLLDRDFRNILALELKIGKPTMTVKLVPDTESVGHPHAVIKIKTPTGEKWILDPVGCVYGFREVLVPYWMYMRDKRCRIVATKAYTRMATEDLDQDLTNSGSDRQEQTRLLHERGARWYLITLLKNGLEKSMLDGAPELFEQRVISFRRTVRAAMISYSQMFINVFL
ncbi:uncharacterized protein BDV17DRAFT_295742 [Aspergillus undulatus]|uniref:uncharacterized protein n=1 Tax=Aspergillus undulatus TaxID=1810928 RepID=UPI003CCE1E1C